MVLAWVSKLHKHGETWGWSHHGQTELTSWSTHVATPGPGTMPEASHLGCGEKDRTVAQWRVWRKTCRNPLVQLDVSKVSDYLYCCVLWSHLPGHLRALHACFWWTSFMEMLLWFSTWLPTLKDVPKAASVTMVLTLCLLGQQIWLIDGALSRGRCETQSQRCSWPWRLLSK